MNSRHPNRVEDYTTANIVLFAVNLLWVMAVIWVTWGFVPTVVFALLVNHVITRVAEIRARRAEEHRPLSERF